MTSARDVRAMVSSIDRCMHVVRSARGADVDVETRKKSREDLEEDIADATAVLRMARRSGVDVSRLVGKVDAAQKLLGKDDLIVVDSLSNNGSVVNHRPNSLEPRHPASPPQSTRIGQMDLDRRDDDNVSLRSSVAERNAAEIQRREEEVRRQNEEVELNQYDDAGSVHSSVAARNAEELQRLDEGIRRRDERRKEDAALRKKKEAARKDAEKVREATEEARVAAEMAMEAIDREILMVQHRREEEEAEDEDERRGSLSNGSDRVDEWLASNADARSFDRSPPRSLRHVATPSVSYHSLPPPPSSFEANAAARVPIWPEAPPFLVIFKRGKECNIRNS